LFKIEKLFLSDQKKKYRKACENIWNEEND
jgi:hypothetical protein